MRGEEPKASGKGVGGVVPEWMGEVYAEVKREMARLTK